MPRYMPYFNYRMGELAIGMSNSYVGALVALNRAKEITDERLSQGDYYNISAEEFMDSSTVPSEGLEDQVLDGQSPQSSSSSLQSSSEIIFYLGFSINLDYCEQRREDIDKRSRFARLLSQKMGEFTAEGIGSGLLLSPINGLQDTEYVMHIPNGIEKSKAKQLIDNFANCYSGRHQGFSLTPLVPSEQPKRAAKTTTKKSIPRVFSLVSLVR